MNWQQLKSYFDQTYDFLDRIKVDNDIRHNVGIHPIIKLSCSLALNTLSNTSCNRIVLIFPNNLYFAQWIATICTLKIMKDDYMISSAAVRFTAGDKLLLDNKYVVEYLDEEFAPELNRRLIYVKCSDVQRHGIPADLKLIYQVVKTDKRLSPSARVSLAVLSAKNVTNPIDIIFGIVTRGNKTLFKSNIVLVSKIGETQHFAKENLLNGTSILDSFLWGKLDVGGNASLIGPQQIQGNPCCLVSSDLFGACYYIQNNINSCKGLVLDGASSFIDNLQLLDDILDRRIPAIAVCDLFDTRHIQHLIDRGFKIWQWNRKNIVEAEMITKTSGPSPFSDVNDSISIYCGQKLDTVQCEYSALNTVVKEVIQLYRLISNDDQFTVPYGKLFQVINEFSRLIRIPDHDWSQGLAQKLGTLRQQFISKKQWLSDTAISCISRIFDTLAGLSQQPCEGENHKVERLRELIRQNAKSNPMDIVVAKTEEIGETESYWREELNAEELINIRFLDLTELRGSDRNLQSRQVVICGWLGENRMSPLVHSNVAPHVTVLVYPFEEAWLRSVQHTWMVRDNFEILAKDMADIIGLNEEELEILECKMEKQPQAEAKGRFNISEFELKIRQYKYYGYAQGGQQDELTSAKLVVFTGNRYVFITESHKLMVVTDIVRGEVTEAEIPRRTVHELRPGDYVLFQESNRDIIREIADKGLARAGKSQLRQVAGIWREALRETESRIQGGLDALVESLQKAGCRRHLATIKNWLNDEDQIGPGMLSDLNYIAKATDNRLLNERLGEVREAISAVRGAHHEASTYIRNRLLERLPEIVKAEKAARGLTKDCLMINLDEFGQVSILKIEEIGEELQQIQVQSVNRLMQEEA